MESKRNPNEGKIKLCNIYNTPSHYRRPLYMLMDEAFDCKFVFGDESPSIKRFDTSLLKNSTSLHYVSIGKMYLMPGMVRYAFKSFDYYIITPLTNNLSMWLFLLILKLFPRKKVYSWTHGMYGNESNRQLFFKRLLFKLCDGEFVYGKYAMNLMKEKGFAADKLFLVHNSLDYDTQLLLRKDGLDSSVYTEHFGNHNPVIVVIGRLNKRKKLPLLIEALDVLRRKGQSYNVVFIGDGEESITLEERIQSLNLVSQVWLYGSCYDEKRNAELLYNSDLCAMPGDIGLTAIHSMMFGVPVITHNDFPHQGPEFETIVPGVTGNFFKNDDVQSLAESIEQWFENNKCREDVRNNCYKVIDTEWTPYYQMNVFKSVLR